jgi:hypothetical protein
MPTVDVGCRPDHGGWACLVRVTDATGSSEHRVRVTAADLRRLAPAATDPSDLVRRSFAFLLEREPRRSILAVFELTVIGRYFPEWEDAVRG